MKTSLEKINIEHYLWHEKDCPAHSNNMRPEDECNCVYRAAKEGISLLLTEQKKEIVEWIGEDEPETYIEDCENCGEKGWGKCWYGHGDETGSAWGDRYVPLGSVVFCEECFKKYGELGLTWNNHEIWKKSSDLPQHEQIRLGNITETNKEAKILNRYKALLRSFLSKETDI